MTEKRNLKECMEVMNKLPSLPESRERYREVYLAVSPDLLQKDRVYDAITGFFDSDVLERLIIKDPGKLGKFNMLAVGLGEGKHELHMLKKLSSHFASVHVTAVDPNRGMLQTFCEKLANCDDTKGIECHSFPGTYAEFLDSPLAGCKFDFITAIHCLYYVGDFTKVVKSLLSSLETSGIMFVDQITDENVFGKAFGQKPWLVDRTSLRIHTWSEVKSLAEQNGFSVGTHRVPIRYDCSSLFDEDSVYGNQLLDWVSMTPYFRRDAPADMVEDVLSFWHNTSSNNNGIFTACGDDGLLVISK